MDQCLLLLIAAKTRSGIKVMLWTNQLVEFLEHQGIITGWAFANDEGQQLQMSDLEGFLFGLLLEIQHEQPNIISEGINVYEAYGMACSW
jgi:hypothetical protein